MHLGDRTHHPREDFQRQEGQEIVNSWSEKRKKSLLIFVVKNTQSQTAATPFSYLSHSFIAQPGQNVSLKRISIHPFFLQQQWSLSPKEEAEIIWGTKRLVRWLTRNWSRSWAEPWRRYLEEAATNSLLLSAITSPTTREQMPPALHQGPVILHRRALPLAALTHLTHRVTQREETRWEILPTSWLLRNTPL